MRLPINSNLGLILPRFRDIAGFMLRTATLSLFHPNCGVFPWDIMPMLGLRGSKTKANYSSNYFRTDPTYTTTVHQRHRRPDRQTDRRTTYDSNTALCSLHYVHRAVKNENVLRFYLFHVLLPWRYRLGE